MLLTSVVKELFVGRAVIWISGHPEQSLNLVRLKQELFNISISVYVYVYYEHS